LAKNLNIGIKNFVKKLLDFRFKFSHKLINTKKIVMNFYSCFDEQGKVIARCQTIQEIEVLKKMGRPIFQVKEMKNEESVVCSLTGSPADYNMDY
tara:strand:- start:2224 stop:2508 length:285 start_codon:yes stop_codon:yes gene_type:complete